MAVSYLILSSTDAQLQPSKELAEGQAALCIYIIWDDPFNVLFNKVDGGVRSLGVRLGAAWAVADEFLDEGIVKELLSYFPE